MNSKHSTRLLWYGLIGAILLLIRYYVEIATTWATTNLFGLCLFSFGCSSLSSVMSSFGGYIPDPFGPLWTAPWLFISTALGFAFLWRGSVCQSLVASLFLHAAFVCVALFFRMPPDKSYIWLIVLSDAVPSFLADGSLAIILWLFCKRSARRGVE